MEEWLTPLGVIAIALGVLAVEGAVYMVIWLWRVVPFFGKH